MLAHREKSEHFPEKEVQFPEKEVEFPGSEASVQESGDAFEEVELGGGIKVGTHIQTDCHRVVIYGRTRAMA